MTSALNSFYSDIAAIENGQEKLEAPELTKNSSSTTNTKKKKTKVLGKNIFSLFNVIFVGKTITRFIYEKERCFKVSGKVEKFTTKL